MLLRGLVLLLVLGASMCSTHSVTPNQVEFPFRMLYSLEQLHDVVIVQSAQGEEGSHIIFARVSTCDGMELVDVEAVEMRPTDFLQLTVLNMVTSHAAFEFESEFPGIYLFQVNFASEPNTCWLVLHDNAVKVFIVEKQTGVNVAPLFQLEIPFKLHRTIEIDGQAAAAVLIVCCIPLILVIAFYFTATLLPAMIDYGLVALFMQSFGCGALLTVSSLHIYPEMIISLESSLEQWKGGALFLGAICLMVLIQIVAGNWHQHEASGPKTTEMLVAAEQQEDGRTCPPDPHAHLPKHVEVGTLKSMTDFKSMPTVVWGLTLGDAVHNLVDGAAITTAFLSCGSSAGWIIVAAIICHEIPQELGDLVLMVTQGATLLQACFMNFLAQLTALIGMGIVLSIGQLSPMDGALMLSFGLGTFYFIALTNIMPKLLIARTVAQLVSVCSGLVLATVLIGLTTMMEEGC